MPFLAEKSLFFKWLEPCWPDGIVIARSHRAFGKTPVLRRAMATKQSRENERLDCFASLAMTTAIRPKCNLRWNPSSGDNELFLKTNPEIGRLQENVGFPEYPGRVISVTGWATEFWAREGRDGQKGVKGELNTAGGVDGRDERGHDGRGEFPKTTANAIRSAWPDGPSTAAQLRSQPILRHTNGPAARAAPAQPISRRYSDSGVP